MIPPNFKRLALNDIHIELEKELGKVNSSKSNLLTTDCDDIGFKKRIVKGEVKRGLAELR